MGNGVGVLPARGHPVERPVYRQPAQLEFAGCESVHATEADLQGPKWRGRRYEYWHRASETVWFVSEETFVHAGPPARLSEFLRTVAHVRGSPIVSFGPGGLRLRRADGSLGDIMQPDLSVFVHPGRTRMPGDHYLVEGDHDWPGVVLEVDHTTDVRRGKLARYEAWGLPELWVEVPDKRALGRPRNLRPGCTIHRLESGRYLEVEESVALPGLRASEIHQILNDLDRKLAIKVARRVGERLGAAEGTTVEDDPLGGWLVRRYRQKGRESGLKKGRSQMTGEILRKRGITLSPGFPDHLPGVSRALATGDERRIVEAAIEASDEADFRARLLGIRDGAD